MKIKQVKPKDLLKVLQKAGFSIKRKRGSHVFLEKNTTTGKLFTSIAIHQRTLPLGTLKAILKQTNISEDELEKLL